MRKPRLLYLQRVVSRIESGGFLLLLGMLTACGSPSSKDPKIRIEHVWSWPVRIEEENLTTQKAMASSAGADSTGHEAAAEPAHSGDTGVVYLTLVNDGGAADRLTEVRADVAEAVELHQTRMQDDRMTMQPIRGGVEIPARGKVEFKPGGVHIMLINLRRSFNPGDRFQLVLKFEKSGEQTIESEVRAP
ncbi:MAG: copper chaperone PCu(A)C [bacterium]